MTRFNTLLATLAAATISFAVPAMAQDDSTPSVEEMAENFKKQKTRGLVLSKPATESAAAQPATVPEDVATIIPKDEQVNISVSFDFDSAALREDEKPKLVALCNALKSADVQMVRILGHTDSSGSADYNKRLSKLRAEEVKRFLVSDCGYPDDRMEALGVGEEFPYDAENPRADVNRRVEFQALS
ncbi:OmpA family protein [uncultured Tateyamaria sp.]|uniref:OmpA family protein n=1 Tax=uncultured Tateyamaria sp. TaxID=455651 RepID=UPI002634D2CA|nr:OmpA family protein [uncultured Tateyamaria sp.]